MDTDEGKGWGFSSAHVNQDSKSAIAPSGLRFYNGGMAGLGKAVGILVPLPKVPSGELPILGRESPDGVPTPLRGRCLREPQ
jgi:hypothetical protein